jgi:hypothetical protein
VLKHEMLHSLCKIWAFLRCEDHFVVCQVMILSCNLLLGRNTLKMETVCPSKSKYQPIRFYFVITQRTTYNMNHISCLLLFAEAPRNPHCIRVGFWTSEERMTDECIIGKDLELSCRYLIEVLFQHLHGSTWRKPRKLSVRVAGLSAVIQT